MASGYYHTDQWHDPVTPPKGELLPASQKPRDSSSEAEASENDDTSCRIREIDEDELDLWTDDGQEQLTQ